MAHQTIFEDPNEEFLDCADEFLDKVIEECLAVPSDDHFSDAGDNVRSTDVKGNVNVNLNQNDQADSQSTYVGPALIPREKSGNYIPLCSHVDDDSFDFDENISIIRRSQSDDFLSTGRSSSKDDHHELQRPTLSEKNISEWTRPPNKSLNDTSSGMTNGTDSDSRSSSCNIDFLAEFERRVDLLEYTDYALEEVFVMLRSCVEKLCVNNGIVFENQTEGLATGETDCSACEESTPETTENVKELEEEVSADKEVEVSAEKEVEISADKEVEVSEAEGTKTIKREDREKSKENETKSAEDTDIIDNKGYLQDLLGLLVELEKRFEHFTAEIGDLVQLGALSAKHAARIEQYARCVQSTYLSMKADNEKMQDYLQLKGTDWVQTQAQLHNEIVRQSEEIQALMKELSKSTLKNRIRNDMQDRHLNMVRKDSHSTEDIVTLMLHQRCSIEKAMALDFSRQSKINELKLLVLQQQSYIQKLELQNKEMDMVLQGLLFPADEPKEPPKEYENICPLSDPISMVSDVLCCDQGPYVIDKSTDCSLVSEQIFQIGESSRAVSHLEAVFDPQSLSYVRREMREHEVPDTQSPHARDLGSGESGMVDSIAHEPEYVVEETKGKLQEPDEPSSFEEIKNIVKIQEAKFISR